jgi:hypothetical protein
VSEQREDPQADRVEDLDVPETESDDVKGGLLLPAIQAAREAARKGPSSSNQGGEQIEIQSWSIG